MPIDADKLKRIEADITARLEAETPESILRFMYEQKAQESEGRYAKMLQAQAERDALRVEVERLNDEAETNRLAQKNKQKRIDALYDEVERLKGLLSGMDRIVEQLSEKLSEERATRDRDIAAAVEAATVELYNRFVFHEVYGGNPGIVDYIFGTWRPATE